MSITNTTIDTTMITDTTGSEWNTITLGDIMNSPIYTTGTGTTITPSIYTTTNTSDLLIRGDATFEGDLTVKGRSLDKTLEKIEERLAILHPNEKLEAKWEKLRGLRKMYMDLEKEIIEQEEMWRVLTK